MKNIPEASLLNQLIKIIIARIWTNQQHLAPDMRH